MLNEPKDCWRCGQPLIFKTMGAGQTVAFLAKNPDAPHSCTRKPRLPPVFLPAMQDCREQVECMFCQKKQMVYRIPARNEMEQFDYALQFEQISWPWKIHNCGFLSGLWDYKLHSLKEECSKSYLPAPYELAILVSAKPIPGDTPHYLVALKSVSEEKTCSFFYGNQVLSRGDLAVLCGSIVVLCGIDKKRKLLINWKNNNFILDEDGGGNPSHLNLPSEW